MARRTSVPTDERARVVLEVLRGDATVAAAARDVGVSEATVRAWKRAFLVAGRSALLPSSGRPGGHEGAIAEVRRLQRALEDVHLLLDAWRAEVGALPPPPTSR
jgi:transposase-like protein